MTAFLCYYTRMPKRLVDLLNQLAKNRPGTKRDKSARRLVEEFIDGFIAMQPWTKETEWSYLVAPDVRKDRDWGEDICQFNISIGAERESFRRIDKTIEMSGMSNASFFLTAIVWGMRNMISEPTKRLEFEASVGPITKVNGMTDVLKWPNNLAKPSDKIVRDWRSDSLDETAIPCSDSNSNQIGEYLSKVQGRSTSGLITAEHVLRDAAQLNTIIQEFGEEANGVRTWIAGPDNGKPEKVRSRRSIAVLEVKGSVWNIVQCYRTILRSGDGVGSRLFLPALIHARKGQKLAMDLSSNPLRLTEPLATTLRKRYADQNDMFWLGFLFQAGISGAMKLSEVSRVMSWRYDNSTTISASLMEFCRSVIPVMSGKTYDLPTARDVKTTRDFVELITTATTRHEAPQ